ncbi:MAG: VacB/RNase II family 3'-5' exoribonuclease [Planctomycetes bacterium]|nr:VacB/RNase II family 3'-5' exoribonuclease [Planctomycetota bacterium]
MSDTSGGSFGSFKDLARALGKGEDEGSEEAEDRGWTLERVDEDADLEPLGDYVYSGETVRQRIDARPTGDGPMTTGPACYRDPDSDEIALLASFRIRTRFPDDVMREVEKLGKDPTPADWQGRLDLRERTIFTIDGEDAKDFDDAISIEVLVDGNVEVGVHIADVGHYVQPGTALDDEALARATSVYLPDQVVPMLPHELSDELCSLVAGRPRLAYSVFMVFDAKGKRIDSRVAKSVIESKHRTTYAQVQELLDGKDTERAREIAYLREDLKRLSDWTRKQQQIRDAKGSLRMQSSEQKFVFDDAGNVVRVVEAARYFSQTLIEETAIAANQAVGDLFRAKGLPAIYRVHLEKDPEEIAALRETLEKYGIRVPDKDRITGQDIGHLIRTARRKPNSEALIQRIMGLVERATYEIGDPEQIAKHFGLAREFYLHFTSPIRRYPDLIVHRWLWAVESREDEASEDLSSHEFLADLADTAAHCSVKSEVAEEAERSTKKLKICQLMSAHIDERLDAKVVRVSRFGIDVHLHAYNVPAFIPTRAIGSRPRVEGSTLTISKGKRLLSFTEGYPVAVVVRSVDFILLQVLLELP